MRKARQLKDWLKSFEEAFSNTEAPEKYVFWVGVGTVGAAMQRNVKFDQVTFQLYPNHYIVLIGPPAVKKTTALNFGISRLRQVDGINVGPSSVTWQNCVDMLEQIQTPSAEEMAATGIAVRDACPIVLPAGELGTLIDFSERAAIDFFTNAWDSPDIYGKGTRIMGLQQINGPCPTIIGGTTPQWIKDNVKGATKGGGFISRCIMPYANRPRRTIAYPAKQVKTNHAELMSMLEHDLAVIAQIRGSFTMSQEAEKYGEVWHSKVSNESYNKQLFDDSDNWANRRYSHVHKLAMVLSVSRGDSLVMELEDMQRAVEYVDTIHKDFDKVFALLDQRMETRAIRDIMAYIHDKKNIAMTDCIVHFRTKFTKREIEDSLNLLLTSGDVVKNPIPLKNAQGGLSFVQVLTWAGGELQ